MKNITPYITDTLVTVFILLTAWLQSGWMIAAVVGYSVIMLILKLVEYFQGGFKSFKQKMKGQESSVPFHVLYAVNTVVLAFFVYVWLGLIWVMIWLYSWKTSQLQNPKK